MRDLTIDEKVEMGRLLDTVENIPYRIKGMPATVEAVIELQTQLRGLATRTSLLVRMLRDNL